MVPVGDAAGEAREQIEMRGDEVEHPRLHRVVRDQCDGLCLERMQTVGPGIGREAGMHAALIEDSDALFARAQQMGLGRLDMAAVLLAVRAGRAGTDRH